MMEVVVTTGATVMQSSSQIITTNKPTSSFLLQAGCPSCHPTNSVKALNGQFSYESSRHTGQVTTLGY